MRHSLFESQASNVTSQGRYIHLRLLCVEEFLCLLWWIFIVGFVSVIADCRCKRKKPSLFDSDGLKPKHDIQLAGSHCWIFCLSVELHSRSAGDVSTRSHCVWFYLQKQQKQKQPPKYAQKSNLLHHHTLFNGFKLNVGAISLIIFGVLF